MLGDPGKPENLFSFCKAMAWDEREQFPEAAFSRLHQLGLHHAFVPKSLGGQFELCESFTALGRTLARRNMSVAVSYSTMLWTMLTADHPMEAHRVDSRGILLRGRSDDVQEGVDSFLAKRPAEFVDRVSDGLPDIFPEDRTRKFS